MPTSEGVRGWRELRARYPRLFLFPFGIGLGVVLAVAHVRNGELSQGLFALLLLSTTGMFLAFSKSEFAVAGMPDGDERQAGLARDAGHIAYLSVNTVAAVGFIWDTFHGRESPFSLILCVGTLSYAIAFVVLRRRR